MLDETARFHVEFVKEPRDIDHALYAIVIPTNKNTDKIKITPIILGLQKNNSVTCQLMSHR